MNPISCLQKKKSKRIFVYLAEVSLKYLASGWWGNTFAELWRHNYASHLGHMASILGETVLNILGRKCSFSLQENSIPRKSSSRRVILIFSYIFYESPAIIWKISAIMAASNTVQWLLDLYTLSAKIKWLTTKNTSVQVLCPVMSHLSLKMS